MVATTMVLVSAVSAAVSTASPLAGHIYGTQQAHIINGVCVTSGAATRAWACGCVGTPARGLPFLPVRKILRAWP